MKNMKAAILAGGLGTRLGEETLNNPKPMVTIGDKPILWHIMKHFRAYGVREFFICCGYKSSVIKDYFFNQLLNTSDIKISASSNKMQILEDRSDNWDVNLIETGLNSNTGGRLKRLERYLEKEEEFFFTYGDGVSDINLEHLLSYHKQKKCLATVTTVLSPARFGAVTAKNGVVQAFDEKPDKERHRVNGGFFVLKPAVFSYIDDDATVWEREPLQTLAQEKNLAAYEHNGFWQAMDTPRDRAVLQEMYEVGQTPWTL